MNRRDFLLGAVALAPVIPTLAELLPNDGVALNAIAHPVTRYTHRTVGLGFAIHNDVLEDEEVVLIGRQYADLARSMAETKETLTANVLNRAFSESRVQHRVRERFESAYADYRSVFGAVGA